MKRRLNLGLAWIGLAGVVAAAAADADEVHLKTGSRLVGTIVENTPQYVVIRVSGTGDVTVRQRDVRKTVKTALAQPEPPPAPKEPDAAPPDAAKPPPPKAPAPQAAPLPAAAPAPPLQGTPVEVLLQKLKDAGPDDRQKLQDEMNRLGPSAVPEMVDLLERVEPEQTGWIVNAVAKAPGKEALRLVLAKAKSEKPAARAAVATLLGILGKQLEGEAVSKTPEPDEAQEGAGAAPPPAAASGVKEETGAAQEVVDERAQAVLRGYLADKDPSVRAAALGALASLHDVESAGDMVEAVADPDAAVRDQAVAAIETLLPRIEGPAWIPLRIVEILQAHDAAELKRAALKALTRLAGRIPMDDERIGGAVAELIAHENKELRAEALTALGRVAPGKAVELLVPRLSADIESDPWSRVQILNALIRANDPRAVPALIDLIENDPTDTVRDAGVRTIQAISRLNYGANTQRWREWWSRLHTGTSEQPQ